MTSTPPPKEPPAPPAPAAPKSEAAQKYRLHVKAGTSYDASSHVTVPVNATETLHLDSAHMLLSLCVRIKHFTGLPESLPTTSPYFDHPPHTSDQYSIALTFIPKVDIGGDELVFGNDFDRPIRDRLPPGFGHALRMVKWIIDPGLDGDPYADKPYLYGPALSSWNVLRIGNKIFELDTGRRREETGGKEDGENSDSDDTSGASKTTNPHPSDPTTWQIPNADSFHSLIVEEGGSDTESEADPSPSKAKAKSKSKPKPPSGRTLRNDPDNAIPPTPTTRKKHFLTPPSNLSDFTFEAGRLYRSDFGNPYLNFNDFSLQLPGFSVNVLRYIDEETHELRYVLRNRRSGQVYVVVVFALVSVEGDGGGVERGGGDGDGVKGGEFGEETPPNPDDVD